MKLRTSSCRTSHHFLLVFLVLVALVLTITVVPVNGQEPQQASKIDLDDLQSMTQEELELICVERGFELIQDNETGEELTHADFVDAARRCLAIEEDMNEILEQNPELAEELLSEIDRMKDEKEQLERERQRMLAQKAELEQQLLEKAKSAEKAGTAAGGGGDSRGMWGASAATASSSSSPQPKQSTSSSSSSSSLDDGEGVPAQVDSTPNGGAAFVSATDTKQSTGNTTLQEATETDGETTTDEDDDLCAPAATETTAAATDDSSKSTDFSLKGLIQEMMTEFEKDVHRITSLIFPVVKPMFEAGNFAWKYVKVLFQGAKRQMEKYRQQQQQPPPPSPNHSDGAGNDASSSSSEKHGNTRSAASTATI